MSEPVALPEWIATEVGNLYLQTVALRRALDEAQRQPEAAVCGRCGKPNEDGGPYHADPLCGQVFDTDVSP